MGYKHTKEAREKIKRNNAKYWLGKKRPPFSKESIEKMRISHLGIKRTPEQRRILSEQRKGEKGSNWQGGKTDITESFRKGVEYKLWRESVFERDNWTCRFCGIKNKKGLGKTIKLNADHIKPFALFPELRYAIDNGRTLCEDCHRKTETFGGRIKKL